MEENAYKVDLWARDEIQKLKRGAPSEEKLEEEHINRNISIFDTNSLEGLNSMKVLAIEY